MNFLRHTLNAAALDIFSPPASGADVTAINTGQTTQDGRLDALEAANTANPPHPHANKALLDATTGRGSIALVGRNLTYTDTAGTAGTAVDLGTDSAAWNATTGVLTINHVGGGSTVANIGVPKILHATTPITYDAPSNNLTIRFVDDTTVVTSLTDLFDSTAFSAVAKNDATRIITYTRLDATTVDLDLSTWVPAALTQAQAVDAASTVEGTITGERLDQQWQDRKKMVIATNNMALQWGVRYVLDASHAYTWPTPTGAVTDWMDCYPAQSWQTFNPPGNWSAAGATSMGAGQTDAIQSTFGMITFHGESAANIKIYG